MDSVYGLTFLLVVAAAIPGPQFGNFGGIPKITPIVNVEIPNPTEALEWTTRIQDLVELTRDVLTGMGDIAVGDNPEVGAKIVVTLNGEIAKAVQILTEYSAKVATSGGRLKRAIDNGKKAYNDVGGVLVGSNDKIEGDKKKLSPDAQKKINQNHKDGVKKCKADPCVNAAKSLQDADEGERQ